MSYLRMLSAAALGLFILTQDAMAQRGGGAARGGVRGAAVGSMVGGSEGAAKGAKIGVVTGATRAAVNREATTRTQYQNSAEYQNTATNFNESPPEFAGTTAAGPASKPSGEAVIRKDGKPVVGITFPDDWNQRTGENYISAVSADGKAFSMLVTLDGVADKQAGIKKVQTGLENYLKDIEFDDPTETKGGASLVTGTGKGKKSGTDVVFVAGVIDAGGGQLVGAGFVVDAKLEDHYKETVRSICETLRKAADFDLAQK